MSSPVVRRPSGWCCREACPAGRIGGETWEIDGVEICAVCLQESGIMVDGKDDKPAPELSPEFLAAAEAEAGTPITAISPEWLLKMAEAEAGKCISVGGLVGRLKDAEPSGVADSGRPGGNGPGGEER